MVNLKSFLFLLAVFGAFKLNAGQFVVWYNYMSSQSCDEDHKIFHYHTNGWEISSYETRYDGTACYALGNFELEDVGLEPNTISDKWLGNCKLYRVIMLHQETPTEPYEINKVIVSNNFDKNTKQCAPASGSYYIVLTRTRTPSVRENQKIMHDLMRLGIFGLKRTNLSVCPNPF